MQASLLNRTFIVFSALMLASSLSIAGTVVEIKNKNETSTILTDGKQARMNMGGAEYVIVNYSDNSVSVVDPAKRQVMLLDVNSMPKGGSAPKVKTAVRNLGSGPVVAGYKTQKFGYTVNGKSCGVIYGSKQAYQLKGVKELFAALKTMVQRQQAMMGGFAGMLDDCTLGDIEMSSHVATIGVPMRTEDRGVVDTEIQSIKVDVALSADTFVIPASYRTVTMAEEVLKVKKDMANMQQQFKPEMQQMQQMMQQLQQSGQLPPEVLEKMRRAQEQFKQYQQ